MLVMPKFDYAAPADVREASRLLAEADGTGFLLGGGTDLLVSVKQRVIVPKLVVSSRRLDELKGIRHLEGEGLYVGPATRLYQLYESPVVRRVYPLIALAAQVVGGNLHQHMGTVGGNLCLDTRCWYYNQTKFWRESYGLCFKQGGDACYVARGGQLCVAAYQGDTAAAFAAMQARLTIAGPRGDRQAPLTDLYSGDGKTPFTLRPGEIIAQVFVPEPTQPWKVFYKKYRQRGSIDFPLAAVAGALLFAADGRRCLDARVVLTGVHTQPVVADGAVAILKGRDLTEEIIQEAGAAAAKQAYPAKTTHDTPQHRKRMIAVLLQEGIREVLGQPAGASAA